MGRSLLSRLYTSQHWPSSMKTAPGAIGGGPSSDDSPSHFFRALTDALLALFRGDWGSTPGGYCHAPVAWSQPVAPCGMRPRGFGCFFSASSAATRFARRSRSASLDASAASSSCTLLARAAASSATGGGGGGTAVAGAAIGGGGTATAVAGAATAYRIRSAVVVGGWSIVFSQQQYWVGCYSLSLPRKTGCFRVHTSAA
mmetsp:Transcript_11108/g.29160  ORF Transcript_11108/g.29160 Transcript_11108/m.29160 type:complete len:200 (-) Transcript_11108:86-685(-)